MVAGGSSISDKWFTVEVEEEKGIQNPPKIIFTAHMCKMDEICTDVQHCYETILPKNIKERFCDKGKVCCKSKSRYCQAQLQFSASVSQVELRLALLSLYRYPTHLGKYI